MDILLTYIILKSIDTQYPYIYTSCSMNSELATRLGWPDLIFRNPGHQNS